MSIFKEEKTPMKKIIGFAGSTSSTSINKQLVAAACSHLHNVSIEILDLNDYEMPIFSVDREMKDGYPQKAHDLRAKFMEADGIVCSMAEHNRTYTAAFKNIFDWCTRVDLNVFQERPMLLLSSSTGGFGGGNVMQAAKGYFPKAGANIIATFSLPKFNDHFKDGRILDSELNQTFKTAIEEFTKALNEQ